MTASSVLRETILRVVSGLSRVSFSFDLSTTDLPCNLQETDNRSLLSGALDSRQAGGVITSGRITP